MIRACDLLMVALFAATFGASPAGAAASGDIGRAGASAPATGLAARSSGALDAPSLGLGGAALANGLQAYAAGDRATACRAVDAAMSKARAIPAERAAERSRLLQPAHFLSALLHLAEGDAGAAVRDVDAAVAASPASPLGLRLAADLYAAAGRADLAEAADEGLLRAMPHADRLRQRMITRIAAGNVDGSAAGARWWLRLASDPAPDDFAWALTALLDGKVDVSASLDHAVSKSAAERERALAYMGKAQTHKRTFGDLMNGGGFTRKQAVEDAERDLEDASRQLARFAALRAAALARSGRAIDARAALDAAWAAKRDDGFVAAVAADIAAPGAPLIQRLAALAAERAAELDKKLGLDGRKLRPFSNKDHLRAVLRLAEAAIDEPLNSDAIPERPARADAQSGRFTVSVDTPGIASAAALEAELLARVASVAGTAGASHVVVLGREDAYHRGQSAVPKGVGLLFRGVAGALGGLDPDDPIEIDDVDPWRTSTGGAWARDQGRRKRATMTFLLIDGPAPGALPVADLGPPSRGKPEIIVRKR